MRLGGKLAVGMAVASGFLLYQFFLHKMLTAGQVTPIDATLMLSPFVLAGGWALSVELGWSLAVLATAALFVAVFAAVSYISFEHSVFTFGIPHMAGNLFMMWFFARTLKEGSEPLITSVARRVHGTLLPEIESYTRMVTLAWSLFFLMQVVISVSLFSFAPLDVWSTYVNLLNIPMIILMFIVEYIYRVLRYPQHKSSIFSAVHFFTQDKDGSSTDKAE